MSGLFASLNSSVRAMSAHSRSLEIAGKNLANVNNTSYARQRVIYGDRGTVVTASGAESLGLEALGIQQLRDTLLDRQVVRETSLTAYYKAMQSAYQRAQASLGQSVASTSNASTSTDTGIAAALDGFFNSFQALAANPTDSGQRAALIQSVGILTDRIQLADARLAQVQSDLDVQISTDVAEANTLLTTLADLNSQIARFEINNPGSAVDLRDQRQATLEKLAAKLPFSVSDPGDGTLQISVQDNDGNDVLLVDGINVTNSLGYNGGVITAGAANTPVALASGSIQGSLDAKNGGVQAVRSNLDALAAQLVASVNGEYGGAFFAAGGTTAATIRLDSSITTASLVAGTGGSGDNSIALAIAQLASKQFSTPGDSIDGTFRSFYSLTVSELGQALAGANTRVTDQNNIETLVRTQRDTVSGVNLDEEMADLMKFQRAFQASSRVFQTIDNLLEVVVTQLGR